jgi:molecular chaperone GrpE
MSKNKTKINPSQKDSDYVNQDEVKNVETNKTEPDTNQSVQNYVSDVMPEIVEEKDSDDSQDPSIVADESETKSIKDDEIKALETKISQLETSLNSSKQESKDWQDKAFRCVADLENARKQNELDISQIKKNTKKYVVKPLLEFLNNQYLVFSFFQSEENEQTKKSISTLQISFSKLISDLQMQGIEIILPEIGTEFNAETMQALNSPENLDETTIVKNIVSLGLKIDNQLVQPVMVMV